MDQPDEKTNKFTFQIGPPTTKHKAPPNMVALKRIQNYSYVLTDEIGLGLTSHVYKGKCELTNKPVAVKVIDTKIKNEGDEFQSQFLKDEIAVLERIKQADAENLLKLQCVIQSKNNLYIITEFCEGKDVAKILRKKTRLNEKQSQSIMKQLLKGYKELYNLGIIHRDLKLANIFITQGMVKIADFGFAISQEMCNKKFDYNVGSPYYMPLEALKNNQYSFLSDVWGLGVIAYQLIYGRVPWKDKDQQILINMIENCPIQKLFDSDKEVSDHYKNFIQHCLTIDIEKRASPEWVVNYEWPLAEKHVQGFDEPDTNYSKGKQNLFRGSSQDRIVHPNHNQYQPQIPSSQKQVMGRQSLFEKKNTRQRNNSQQHKNMHPQSLNKINVPNFNRQDKFFMSKNNVSPKRVSDQQEKHNFPRSKVQTLHNNQRYFNQFTNLPFSQSQITPKVEQKRMDDSFIKRNEENSCAQEAILGQIHYCRFLFQIFLILQKRSPLHPEINVLKVEIASRLAFKMSILMNMVHKQDNKLQAPGFTSFVKSQKWKRLKDIIFQYNIKYRNQMKNQQIRVINHFNDLKRAGDDILVKVIKHMRTFLPQNQRILEFLIYYYQIREEDGKTSPHNFYQKTKIHYIVDQMCYYREGEGNMNIRLGNEVQKQNLQRLVKKMGILGF